MKYVAFRKPDIHLDGLDWVYNLTEDRADRQQDYDFFLIDAKSPKAAREIAIDAFYEEDMNRGGLEYIVSDAFNGFCGMEYDNDGEIFQFFGHRDGKTVFEFYKKYTWDAFIDGKITFYEGFDPVDRDKFYDFDPENLKKLYRRSTWYDVLVMPITKDFSKVRNIGKKAKTTIEPNAQDITE